MLLCLGKYEQSCTRPLKVLHKCCNTDVLGVLLIYPHSPSGAVHLQNRAYISVKLLSAVFILMYYILQSGRIPLHAAVLKENCKEVVNTLIKQVMMYILCCSHNCWCRTEVRHKYQMNMSKLSLYKPLLSLNISFKQLYTSHKMKSFSYKGVCGVRRRV